MVQPLPHHLQEIIIRPAEVGIAPNDEIVLLALQGAAAARIAAASVPNHAGIYRVDLAVEISQFGIGADRLLHRATGGGAVETWLVIDRQQRPKALKLLRQ